MDVCLPRHVPGSDVWRQLRQEQTASGLNCAQSCGTPCKRRVRSLGQLLPTAQGSAAHCSSSALPCPDPISPARAADAVGATSKDVSSGFGGGPERLGAADVRQAQAQAAGDSAQNAALQRGQQQKPAGTAE